MNKVFKYNCTVRIENVDTFVKCERKAVKTSAQNAVLKALLESRCDLPVILWDERRTSIAAHSILHANGKKMKDHRKNVDAVAATLILEGYLGTL